MYCTVHLVIFLSLLVSIVPSLCNERNFDDNNKYFEYQIYNILYMQLSYWYNLGPNGSAIFTLIGYNRTNKLTDRQAKYILRKYWYYLQSITEKSMFLL